jgi:hypothetical protein
MNGEMAPLIGATGSPIGMEEYADIVVAMCIKGLEEALGIYSSTSEKGQVCLDCLKKLGKVVPDADQKLAKAAQAVQSTQAGMPSGAGGVPPGGATSTPTPPPTTGGGALII